ncbi:hypothetical protein [Actinomadura sp. 7K507]|uniref:hypothetical protein n=1 Tax=Actinomadura sp. 7K507 TaxID=2530365 RepID=UPI001050D95E|nr:hypothetical protein [Actinomadura sp. 7K507]TDC89587.1 hypothetical protein E1285_16295 [Actinomadura sp. 7K507]
MLKRALRRAQRHDKVARNVAELVDTPRGRPGRPSSSLSRQQAAAHGRTSPRPSFGRGALLGLPAMINWHATAGELDDIWKPMVDVLDMGVAGAISPEVRADLDKCVFGVLQGHGHKLAMGRGTTMLTPSGLVVPQGAEYMDMLSQPDVDFGYDDDSVADALNALLTEARGRAAELSCVCLAYHVRMGEPGREAREIEIRKTTELQDKGAVTPPGTIQALAIDLEHRAGHAVAVFLPYDWDTGNGLRIGDLIAGPSHRRIWN